MRRWRLAYVFFVFPLVALPAFGQTPERLPFDVSRHALTQIDTTLLQWTSLRIFTGGIEGELFYRAVGVTPEVCHAVALVGMVRLRNSYKKENEADPVVLRLRLLCASAFHGSVNYDGVNTRLQIIDSKSGSVLYRAREPGLP